jgi:DNA recombination protein RmuC
MDYLLLLFLIILLIIVSIILINIKKNDQKESNTENIFQEYNEKQQTQNESLGRQEQALSDLRITIQDFQEPLQKLRNYLSGGTKAGQFGEWSLQAMMQDIFPENRYKENEEIIEGSGQRVEFALTLPGGLLQPIDAKFPSGLFDNYLYASSKGNRDQVNTAKKDIERHVKNDAEDIQKKYILAGKTSDMGIMYIPSESLLQLIDSMNIREDLFRDYRVLLLGPNSLAAYLISVSMNFRVESFNDRASEIMDEFGKLKKEFEKFNNSTNDLRKKAEEVLNKIDDYSTRERQMSKAIKNMDNLNTKKK